MRALSPVVGFVFTVVLLVSVALLAGIYLAATEKMNRASALREAVMERMSSEYLRILDIRGEGDHLLVSFTALKEPVDLNRVDVFLNHRYMGRCTELNCLDETGNSVLMENEKATLYLTSSVCDVSVKLDYMGSETSYTYHDPSCWSCRRVLTVSSTFEENQYPVRVELNADNFDLPADPAEFRFYDGESKLDYWVERWDDTGGVIWVEVNLVAGEKNLYLYYCNPYAQDESNGNAVFTLFDFDDTNLFLLFRMDEGTGDRVHSEAGSYEGNIVGPTWTTGLYGYALYFDGNDDYVETNYLGVEPPLSVVLRLRPNALQPSSNVGKPFSDGAWNRFVGVLTYSTTEVRFYVTYDANGTSCYSNVHPAGVWYTIAALVEENREVIYINGVEEGSCSIGQVPDPVYNLYLGVENAAYPDFNYNGVLDEVIVFGRLLTPEEVVALSEGYLDYLTGLWVVRKRIDPEPVVKVGQKETGAWVLN